MTQIYSNVVSFLLEAAELEGSTSILNMHMTAVLPLLNIDEKPLSFDLRW
jgi:hypothetical protein